MEKIIANHRETFLLIGVQIASAILHRVFVYKHVTCLSNKTLTNIFWDCSSWVTDLECNPVNVVDK